MELTQAILEDYQRIRNFYIYVIEQTPTMAQYCRWVYGKHPTDELVMKYIRNGEMYYYEQDGRIAAVIALTEYQDRLYDGAPWQKTLGDDEVMVGHIMCVDPALSRQGIAKKLLADVCRLCREKGKKAYRFDTLKTNLPAQSLYDSQGFRRIQEKPWPTPFAGTTDYVLYEMLL